MMLIYAFLLVVLQCIVQSYLQWLQDSDYNPNCSLCNDPLTAQDTVRLVCYGEIIKLLCVKCSCTTSTVNMMKNYFANLEPCHETCFSLSRCFSLALSEQFGISTAPPYGSSRVPMSCLSGPSVPPSQPGQSSC